MVSLAVSLAVFRFVDLTFTQMAMLLVAPAAQAAVLTWPAGFTTRFSVAARSAWGHRLAPPVLLLDGVLLATGLIWWSSSSLGFGAPVTIQPTWIAVKACAAACLCIVAVRGVSLGRRAVLCVVLLLVAAHAQLDLFERLFVALDQRAGIAQEVFLRLAWYGCLYVAGVIAVVRVGRTLHEAARFWFTSAIALTVPAVLLVMLSMFNNPGVLQPWRGLALICASAVVTALLLGVLLISANDEDRL